MKRRRFLQLGGSLGLGLVAGQAAHAADPRFDRPKNQIEGPVQGLLGRSIPAPAPAGQPFVNPRVAPGKVNWHPDFDTACAAAQKSNKPVLLFQMMGRLDEKFC